MELKLEDCLNQENCGERLLATLVRELKSYSEAEPNESIRNKYKECYQVGLDLLFNRDYYFNYDEKYLELTNKDNIKPLELLLLSELKVDAYKKRTEDLNYFFNLLRSLIEEDY